MILARSALILTSTPNIYVENMENNTKSNAAMRHMLRGLFGKDDNTVFVISGAPGSGKSTYVESQKQKGDLVVDLDMIAAALQGERTAHPDYTPVMDAVMAAREAVYRVVESRQGQWNRAYIITSSPNKAQVNELAKRLDGQIVRMQATQNECISRIRSDRTRVAVDRDIGLVNKWFSEQTE